MCRWRYMGYLLFKVGGRDRSDEVLSWDRFSIVSKFLGVTE